MIRLPHIVISHVAFHFIVNATYNCVHNISIEISDATALKFPAFLNIKNGILFRAMSHGTDFQEHISDCH